MRAVALALVLALVAGSAFAQEMSPQQRDFIALYTQCGERIRSSGADPLRRSAREACQAQLLELVGSKLDNWIGRVTNVRVEPDTVEMEVAPFDGEKIAILTRILNIRIYTSDGREMSSQRHYEQLVSQLKRLNVRRGDSLRVTSVMLTGELVPGMMPHGVQYANDRLEISLNTVTVARP